MGVRVIKDGVDCKLANVFEARAAHKAGLSAGDILMAVNGLRVTFADAVDGLSAALGRYRVGEIVLIHAFRRDELLTVEAKLQADDVPAFSLSLPEKSKAALAAARPSLVFAKRSRKV